MNLTGLAGQVCATTGKTDSASARPARIRNSVLTMFILLLVILADSLR
jgi:hypothetical protein